MLDDRPLRRSRRLGGRADASSARFLELADARLSGYVRPLKDSLERMDLQLQGVERIRQEAYGSAPGAGERAVGAHWKPRERPPRPHVRGRWGEVQLRNVVEQAGMVEHCDYVRQATVSTRSDSAAGPSWSASPAGST